MKRKKGKKKKRKPVRKRKKSLHVSIPAVVHTLAVVPKQPAVQGPVGVTAQYEPVINPQEIEDLSKSVGRQLTEEEARMLIRHRLTPEQFYQADQAYKRTVAEIMARFPVVKEKKKRNWLLSIIAFPFRTLFSLVKHKKDKD